MKIKKMPSRTYLKLCLDYDPLAGEIYWRKRPPRHFKSQADCNGWNKRFSGRPAGSETAMGYRRISIDGVAYQLHRVVYKFITGNDPNLIDHRDRDKTNNREANLRDVDHAGNAHNKPIQANNTTGFIGVDLSPCKMKYRARINHFRTLIHLGTFDTIAEAIAARVGAEIVLGRRGDNDLPAHLISDVIQAAHKFDSARSDNAAPTKGKSND